MQQQLNATQGEKKYTSAEFSKLTGIPRRTLSGWACKGKLIPVETNGRRKPSYYSAAQIEVAKKLFSKSTEATPANVIPLFSTNAKATPDDNQSSVEQPAANPAIEQDANEDSNPDDDSREERY